jgi:hypothetical protein
MARIFLRAKRGVSANISATRGSLLGLQKESSASANAM